MGVRAVRMTVWVGSVLGKMPPRLMFSGLLEMRLRVVGLFRVLMSVPLRQGVLFRLVMRSGLTVLGCRRVLLLGVPLRGICLSVVGLLAMLPVGLFRLGPRSCPAIPPRPAVPTRPEVVRWAAEARSTGLLRSAGRILPVGLIWPAV